MDAVNFIYAFGLVAGAVLTLCLLFARSHMKERRAKRTAEERLARAMRDGILNHMDMQQPASRPNLAMSRVTL